ncbi:MAG TPA: histidinol-phosphate transaminase [Gammaproteobacteria bacterium]|nr:histidinol-phosphate transaminase [Gammaproteobacteria bacterium]
MTDALIERWVNAQVRALTAYSVPDAAGLIKLDAMENPYTWPMALRTEWLERLRHVEINRYPDPAARALTERLHRYLALNEKVRLLLGNGSDELIQIIALALRGEGRVLLAPEPTFVMYRMVAEVLGQRFVGVPLNAGDFSLDLPAMLAAIKAHEPAIVFLACPNNPTGNLFERRDVELIIESAPGLVVIDEAYFPFARETWLYDLPHHPNLVVLQTLSKVGLAGLRVGMLAGAPAWCDEFNKIRLPYNINTLSQVSAAFILEHADLLDEQAAQITHDREELTAQLRALPDLKVWPSRANFVLFRVAHAREVYASLKQGGVLIRRLDNAHPLLADCLRVSIGTPAENTAFLNALRTTLKNA